MCLLLKSATAAALVVALSFGDKASAAPLGAPLVLRDALSPTTQTVGWGGGYGYGGYAYGGYGYGGYGYECCCPPPCPPPCCGYSRSSYYGDYGYGGYAPYRSYWGY
jgi:hypothetical protein